MCRRCRFQLHRAHTPHSACCLAEPAFPHHCFKRSQSCKGACPYNYYQNRWCNCSSRSRLEYFTRCVSAQRLLPHSCVCTLFAPHLLPPTHLFSFHPLYLYAASFADIAAGSLPMSPSLYNIYDKQEGGRECAPVCVAEPGVIDAFLAESPLHQLGSFSTPSFTLVYYIRRGT